MKWRSEPGRGDEGHLWPAGEAGGSPLLGERGKGREGRRLLLNIQHPTWTGRARFRHACPRVSNPYHLSKEMRIHRTWLVVLALAIAGCTSTHSYRRIPERYVELNRPPAQESYLIEVVPAFTKAFAKRYDFEEQNGIISVQIQEITSSGPKPAVQKSGTYAQQILGAFRSFDWSRIEVPEKPTDTIILTCDDPEMIFKARTSRSYRETEVGMSDCKALRELMKAVDF
jgi:hypothetical protein